MTKFNYINTNIDRIRKEIRMGLISTSTLSHYVIYSRYDYYRKLGNYVCISVLLASDTCKVSERLVYRIIKEMEENIYEDVSNNGSVPHAVQSR